ncbi:methyltransferase domain-containing protein [Arcobacter sp. FWKO B]|uniref:methyltransferase domain-containing protein n=1 Tax=Arcobacter sp. FWKO B TaxID=2593672 RepID=UPI0018A4B7D3|nr:methyltransferase domain-containing protein [Arcobacter sp. FWKO B]QOG12079.1 class I SAM-dependent methyltransferase [Arcobacter sp. FWKO B]
MYVIDKCPICEKNKNKNLYSIEINEQLEISKVIDNQIHNYSIVFCENCGLLYRNTRFSNDELSLMYSKEVDNVEYARYENRSKHLEEYLTSKLNKKIEHMNILDVGGGKGEITHYFSQKNYCTVLEFDIPNHNINDNLRLTSDIKSVNQPDIIFFNHIVEHLNNPYVFIDDILNNIHNECLVYIEVPFEISHYLLLKTAGHYEHINYFSKQSLENFVKLLGGNIICVETINGFGNSMLSIAALFRHNPNARLKNNNIKANYLTMKQEAYNIKNLFFIVKNKILSRFRNV